MHIITVIPISIKYYFVGHVGNLLTDNTPGEYLSHNYGSVNLEYIYIDNTFPAFISLLIHINMVS